MKGDDDDDEDSGAIGVGRYPCLPSLVALQQMRNRLHLAHTGRKLMKWTALATGREQRKLANGLIEVYKNYEIDIKNAYIQLARCRYFYPNLNLIVTGNPPKHPKTTNKDSYAHLAMDKGGQCVAEAKRLWFELLKKMLMMLQLRTSYLLAEMAHNNANKKWNVLSKIVIPRTEKSIKYILDELEERDREEFFRMKKILAVKAKKKKADEPAEGKKEVCPICEEIKQEAAQVGEDRCYVCSKLLSGEEEEKGVDDEKEQEDKRKLDEFKSQIDLLVGMTKEINEQGIVKENFSDFIQTAEVLKDKLVVKEKEPNKAIPFDAPLDRLCPSCIKKLNKQIAEAQQVKEDVEIQNKLESLQKLQGKVDEEIKQSFGPKLFETPPSILPPEECPICVAEKQKARVDDEVKSDLRVKSSLPSKPSSAMTPQKKPSSMKSEEESPPPETVCPHRLQAEKSKPPCVHMQQASETGSTDMEYGIFETQYKEVTKIIRTRNEDGTISEERKVIRVKKEMRTPEVDEKTQQRILRSIRDGSASASNTIDRQESETSGTSRQSRRTVGVALIDPYVRRAHSVITVPTSQVDVESRSCVSDCSELSLLDCEICCTMESSNLESMTNSEKIHPKCPHLDSDSSMSSLSDF